ncbi:MAG: hydantoinase/oxoprolinase family protein, partial [Gammaproteobacteria bacterium]
GDMQIDRSKAEAAIGRIAGALGLPLKEAAEGVINIVNENMFGALRLVSIEQGYDPRDFALIAFGGAGPLHANALGRLMNSWPVIIPPGPGVLCASGDATTRLRDEASRTFIRRFSDTSASEISSIFSELAEAAARALDEENVPRDEQSVTFQADLRYHGQGLLLTVDTELSDLSANGLDVIGDAFDAIHRQLFTFALDVDKELVNLRAVVQGRESDVAAPALPQGSTDASAAELARQSVYMDGQWYDAPIFDRGELKSGNMIPGPAIVTEMDSTSIILPGHTGTIDKVGNIVIQPDANQE